MKGVFAAPGSFIPGTNTTLQVGEIRGVQSAGMLLSAREMGLGEDHSGIVDLPQDAPVGVPYVRWAGLDDPVIEVNVTPNRGDCFSVRGIARDLAAAGIGVLKPWQPARIEPRFDGGPHWRIEWPEACPWILGRTIRAREEQSEPEMAAGPADLDRAAADQRAGGRDELLHRRSRPPAARVRRGQADRRRADAAPRRAARRSAR